MKTIALFFSNRHLERNRLIRMQLRDTIHKPDILRIRWTQICRRKLPPIIKILWTPWPILNRNVSVCRLQSRWRVKSLSCILMVLIQIRWPKFVWWPTLWPSSPHVVSCLLLWIGHRIGHDNDLIRLATLV